MQLSMQTLLKAQPAQHLIANKWQVGVGQNKGVRCPVGGELLEQLATGSVAGVEAAMDKIAKGFSQLKDRLPDTDLDSQFKAVQLKCVYVMCNWLWTIEPPCWRVPSYVRTCQRPVILQHLWCSTQYPRSTRWCRKRSLGR